jgi:hypothetical protein
MWPFSDMSLEAASWWSDAANLVLVGSLVAGVLSTFAIVRLGNVKEHHWDTAREDARIRVAALDAETEKAKAASAEANARALEAQVALEQFKAPRSMSPEQRQRLVRSMSKWKRLPDSGQMQSVAVFAVDSSFESHALADQIADALGPSGADFSINRYPVMYGQSFSVAGVGILKGPSVRGNEVANDLVRALNSIGILTFVVPEKRMSHEEPDPSKDNSEPYLSSLSIMVGEKPRL